MIPGLWGGGVQDHWVAPGKGGPAVRLGPEKPFEAKPPDPFLRAWKQYEPLAGRGQVEGLEGGRS